MFGLFYYHTTREETTFIAGIHSENLSELKELSQKIFYNENNAYWEIWEQDEEGMWGNCGDPIECSPNSGFYHFIYK